MRISITKSAVKNVGKEMNEQSERLKKETQKLFKIFEGIQENWQGDDASKMIEGIKKSFIPHLNNLAEGLSAYGNYLQKIPDMYDSLDDIYVNKKY